MIRTSDLPSTTHLCLALLLCVLFCSAPSASELVYTPKNPSFGGNPLNGTYLLNLAQLQNSIKDPNAGSDDLSALDEFNDRLQRSLLNRLTNTISNNFVDENGNLVPGTTETTDFIIQIADNGSGTLTVTTVDKITGDSTSFIVGGML